MRVSPASAEWSGALAVSDAAKVLNPGRGLREAQRQMEISPSAQNKATLATEFLLAGQPEASAALYRETLTGIHATDPALMLGLARSLFALGDLRETQVTLERLREANLGYASPDGHLLEARSLELQGKTDAALYEYAAPLLRGARKRGRGAFAQYGPCFRHPFRSAGAHFLHSRSMGT